MLVISALNQQYLTSHSTIFRWSPSALDKIMTKNYKLITSMREPVDRFLSMYSYERPVFNESLELKIQKGAL